MTKKFQAYKCTICGNIVEVVHEGAEALVCCGQPMKLLEEKSEEEGNEKHLPLVEKTNGGIKVKIGSVQHPMEEKHYIEWIEVITNDGSFKKFLNPGDVPEATFNVDYNDTTFVREHCSIHGLWKKALQ